MNGTLLVEQCKSCVTATIEQNGDASRCHSCLHSMASYEIRASCLTCVPSAEKLKLGWACAQYCTHHHIISTKGEAEQCQGCLMNQEIKDKWGCHVCMEQIPGSEIETRQGCFNCLANGGRTSSGSGLYLCAACGRVRDSMKRRECYRCLKEDTESGSSCLSRHNVSLKYNKPPSRAAEIIDRLRSHPPPH